jgi:hypothetical protein
MEATVLATGDLGPTRVRIRFDRPLDDPSLTLLAWGNGRLRRVEPPPVGGVIAVPLGAAASGPGARVTSMPVAPLRRAAYRAESRCLAWTRMRPA